MAGLCPTTEGNLGDGIFPLAEYRASNGRYGIGGDSHVSRDPAEELRLLEYFPANHAAQAQRGDRRENPCGRHDAVAGSRRGRRAGARAANGRAIAPGMRADLVVLDPEHVDLQGRSGDAIANALVFAGSNGMVRDVMVAGRWVVKGKRHAKARTVAAAYKRALKELLTQLGAVAEVLERLGVGERLDVLHRPAMHHLAHRELDDLAALGARNIGDLHDLRRHGAGWCCRGSCA